MSQTKRQNLPKGLWMVATPIGNLADLSVRAQWAFADADAILCEDTRRTSTLLSALGLGQKISSLHRLDAHSAASQIQHWVRLLKEGKNLLYVSDAGTPAVSDPGSQLVAQAHAHEIRVMPVPGPSAPLALISCSGFESGEFTFRGFFPRRKKEQEEELKEASQARVSRVFVWFESPQRILDALETLASFHPTSRTVVGKELTKLHERIFVGAAQDVQARVKMELNEQGEIGEWCFAVEFEKNQSASVFETTLHDSAKLALKCLLDCQVSPSIAVKKVSQIFGVSKNEFYSLALELSGKNNPEKS